MALSVDTYYFDASVSGPTDSSAAWTADANAFDGSTATVAVNSGGAGTFSSKTLNGTGTTAPLSGSDYILAVRFRFYGTVSSCNAGVEYSSAQLGASATNSSPGAGAYSSYVVLPSPSGGWSWNILATQLGVRFWALGAAPGVARAEIEVTHAPSTNLYNYPIMSGENANFSATNAARFFPLAQSNDTVIGTTNATYDVLMPFTTQLSNFKTNIGIAPGAGITRTVAVDQNDAASALSLAIADPLLTGSNTTDYVSYYQGDSYKLRLTASGTPVASTPNSWRVVQTGESQVFGSFLTASASADRFTGVHDGGGAQTTAVACSQVAPATTTLKNLVVEANGTLTAGTSYLIEIYTGTLGSETASGVKVTVDSTNAFITPAIDSTHSIAVTQGQGMYVRIIPTGTPTARTLNIGIENATGDGTYWLLQSSNTNLSTTATVHNNWYGTGVWQAAEADVQALAYATTLKGFYGVVSSDPAATKSRTLSFRQNGVNTSAVLIFSNSGATKSWTGSIPIATDDLINTREVPVNTPALSTLKYGLVFQANPLAVVGKKFVASQAMNRAATY